MPIAFIVMTGGLVCSVLPADLTAIEAEAFCGSDVEYLVLPDTLTSIGSRAFADCKELVCVEFTDSVTTIAVDAFAGCGDLMIVAPEGSAAYEFAEANGYDWMNP